MDATDLQANPEGMSPRRITKKFYEISRSGTSWSTEEAAWGAASRNKAPWNILEHRKSGMGTGI
jgi:hypothetical protein